MADAKLVSAGQWRAAAVYRVVMNYFLQIVTMRDAVLVKAFIYQFDEEKADSEQDICAEYPDRVFGNCVRDDSGAGYS